MARIPGTTALLLALALAAACDTEVVACRPEGETRCAGVCRDAASFQTDPDNCGACGVVCGLSGCADGACQCGGLTPLACGDACCAGPCCGSGCQTAHANGLGQTYQDCGSLDEWTADQARLAGEAWSATGTTRGEAVCSVNCVCRESAGQAAVWCYAGSNAPGLVLVTDSPNCFAAACPFPGYGLPWH